MIFVGCQPGTKGYRAYDPVTNRVTITRDAVFDENARWDWSSPDNPVNTFGVDTFTVKHMVFEPQPTPGDGIECGFCTRLAGSGLANSRSRECIPSRFSNNTWSLSKLAYCTSLLLFLPQHFLIFRYYGGQALLSYQYPKQNKIKQRN